MIGGKEVTSEVPVVPPMSTRKVPFEFNGEGITAKGQYECSTVTYSVKEKRLMKK